MILSRRRAALKKIERRYEAALERKADLIY